MLGLAAILPAQTSRSDSTQQYYQALAVIDSSPPLLSVPISHAVITLRPPVTIPRIITEWAAAFILARYGGEVGSMLAHEPYDFGAYDERMHHGISVGWISGSQIGSMVGVKIIAAETHHTASSPATLAGSLTGFFLGKVAANYTGNYKYMFAGSATGAVIGFNLTRRSVPINTTTPYLSNRQFLAQVATGTVGGYVGMLTAGYLTTLKPSYQNCDEGLCRLEQMFNAFVFGAPIGCTLGTWLPGSIGPETGSLPATAAGCMVGWFVTLHAVYYGMLPWWTFPVIPSCGAVVGFNLTRHYKKNRAPTAALTAVPYLEMRYGTPILGMQLTIP